MRAFFWLAIIFAVAGARAKDAPEFLSQPLTATKRDTYYTILDRKLLLTPADMGRVTFRPSFDGEFAVSVYRVRGHGTDDTFRVTLTKAAKNVWYSLTPKEQGIKAPPDYGNKHDTSDQISVERTDVDIDRELALAIQHAWQTMLARDPVPDPDADRYISVDGFSAEFSVRLPDGKTIVRETRNPHGQPARDFVQVSLLLADYCSAPAADRPLSRKLLLEGLRHVLQEAEKT